MKHGSGIGSVVARAWRSRRIWAALEATGRPLRTVSAGPASPLEYDIVITWVDRTDPSWLGDFGRFRAEAPEVPLPHVSDNRYTDFENLRFMLRSVSSYVRGFRKIHVVTVNPPPPYIVRDDPRLTFVDHRSIFPEAGDLPVFNATSIESCLHRIPGLLERFVYFNDDLFPTRPKNAEDFFPGGCAALVADNYSSLDPVDPLNRHHLSVTKAFGALDRRFGKTPRLFLDHRPIPLLKSGLFEVENEFREEIVACRRNRFPADNDIAVTAALAPYWLFHTGRARLVRPRFLRVYDYDRRSRLRHAMFRAACALGIRGEALAIYDQPDWDAREYGRVKRVLRNLFRLPSPFETDPP